jgi:hypothetical protein
MVIEAKVTMNDLARTEEALKRYMAGMLFPFGLFNYANEGLGLSGPLFQLLARVREASRGVRQQSVVARASAR